MAQDNIKIISVNPVDFQQEVYSAKDEALIPSVLIDTAFTSIRTLNTTGQPTSGVHVRTGEITGPNFETDRPFFVSTIETNFQATVIS